MDKKIFYCISIGGSPMDVVVKGENDDLPLLIFKYVRNKFQKQHGVVTFKQTAPSVFEVELGNNTVYEITVRTVNLIEIS